MVPPQASAVAMEPGLLTPRVPTQPVRKQLLKRLPQAQKVPYAGGVVRSQKLLENIKKIVRARRRLAELPTSEDKVFGEPEQVKFGDAPHQPMEASGLSDVLPTGTPGTSDQAEPPDKRPKHRATDSQ